MRPPAVRLLIAVVVFLLWIGYLAYQVLTRPTVPPGEPLTGRPLVLSRPQIMLSRLDVLAEVPDKEGVVEVEVKEVLFQKDGHVKAGDKLKVINIGEACPPHSIKEPPKSYDWTGPGTYILPLQPAPFRQGEYEVVPIPEGAVLGRRADWTLPPRIYPGSQEALAQYRQIKPE
jgi:hypothetical protein